MQNAILNSKSDPGFIKNEQGGKSDRVEKVEGDGGPGENWLEVERPTTCPTQLSVR